MTIPIPDMTTPRSYVSARRQNLQSLRFVRQDHSAFTISKDSIDGAFYVARIVLFDKAAVIFRTRNDGHEHPARHR